MTAKEIYEIHKSPISKSKKLSDDELFAVPAKVKADYRIKDKRKCKLFMLKETLTVKEYEELKLVFLSFYRKVKPTKYRNVGIVIDGIYFASIHEGNYYSQLKMRLKSGLIAGYKRQIPFTFIVNEIRIGKYIADYGLLHLDGSIEIVDTKSSFTAELPEFLMKKQLMLACFGVEIKIVY